MTDPRPPWLLNALAGHVPVPAHHNGRAPVRPGDVRRLIPMDESDTPARLVLVQHVEEAIGYADVMLLSPEASMASDNDLLLEPEFTRLAYPLVLLSDVSVPVYLVQIVTFLVSVVPDELRHLAPAGEPLADERDPRWTWKERELDALTALAAECTAELVDGPNRSVVDPRSFAANVADEYLEAAALGAARACRAGQSVLPHEILQSLAHSGQDNLAVWSARSVLVDVVNRSPGSLLLFDDTIDDASNKTSEVDSGLLALVEDRTLAAILAAQIAHGRRNLRLLSTSNLWFADQFDAVYPNIGGGALEIVVNGQRCQLLATLVDPQEVAYA